MNVNTSIQTTSGKPIYYAVIVVFLAVLSITNMSSYFAGERSAKKDLDLVQTSRASELELLGYYMNKMTLHEMEIRVIDKVLTDEQKQILKAELSKLK